MQAEMSQNVRTRILLVDDHPFVRDGVRARLEIETDFAIVGELADGEQLLEAVQDLHPDVVVLDLLLPGQSGIQVAQKLTRAQPEVHIIMLSMSSEEAYVARALYCGARGYVAKSAPSRELVQAIRCVMEGGRYLSPPHSNESIDTYLRRAQSGEFNVFQALTGREREVASLIVEGMNSREIAEALSISERTVETHRSHIRKKLGAKSTADMVRLFIQLRDQTGEA